MNERVVALQRELSAIKADMETLQKDSMGNLLNSDQQAKWSQLLEQRNQKQQALLRETEISETERALESLAGEDLEIYEAQERANSQRSPKLFNSLGEQMQAILAAIKGGSVDERLLRINAAASGAATSPLEDGGFLIQTESSREIWQNPVAVGQLAPQCAKIQIGEGFNAVEVPRLKDTNRTDGSRLGGLAVYRAGEAASVDFTKIKFDKVRMEATKMMGYAAFTHEVLRDAAAVESMTINGIKDEFSVVLDEEIYDGDGSQGRCFGYMSSGAKIQISKETNQPGLTVVPQNVVKMYARMHPRFRPNAQWHYNIDIEPQLHLMTLPIGTAGIPVFLPPTGLVSAPNGMLYGKPLVPVETAETLGTAGDLNLVDLSQYVLVYKEGIRVARSEHVLFASDQVVVRFSMEVNGQAKYDTPITPKKGTNTLSPFITLATRA